MLGLLLLCEQRCLLQPSIFLMPHAAAASGRGTHVAAAELEQHTKCIDMLPTRHITPEQQRNQQNNGACHCPVTLQLRSVWQVHAALPHELSLV
jgi:hypothetical protein